MYFLDGDGGVLVTSASDLTLASGCEFAFLRVLDVRLGEVHEHRLLEHYREEHRDELIELPRPGHTWGTEVPLSERHCI